MKKDIQDLNDIKFMVDTFYGKIQKDDLIGPIFNGIIQNRWPEHLEKMYTFWQTILLNDYTYSGRPFPPHAELPVTEEHFNRWKQIFSEVVLGNFEGEKADEAIWRADKMATMFLSKITYFRENNIKPLT
nr:group III truncated hemoglobin [uncultured Flavobacterium sp.]